MGLVAQSSRRTPWLVPTESGSHTWTTPKQHKNHCHWSCAFQHIEQSRNNSLTQRMRAWNLFELTSSKLKHPWLCSVGISPNGWAFLRENKRQRSTCTAHHFQGCWIWRSSALPSAWARLPYNQIFCSAIARVGEETNHQQRALQHAERAPCSAIEVQGRLLHICCRLVLTDWFIFSWDLQFTQHFHCFSLCWYAVAVITAHPATWTSYMVKEFCTILLLSCKLLCLEDWKASALSDGSMELLGLGEESLYTYYSFKLNYDGKYQL